MAFLSRSKLFVTIFFRYIVIFGDPYLFIYLFTYFWIIFIASHRVSNVRVPTSVFFRKINSLFVYFSRIVHSNYWPFFTRKINKITYCFNRN